MKTSTIWKNWTVHNIIGHPLMEILHLMGFKELGERVHDATTPPEPQKDRDTSKWYDCAHCDAGYLEQECTCEVKNEP